jgi:hypothetical protein
MKKLPRLLQKYPPQKKLCFWVREAMFWFAKYSNIF